MSYTLPQDIFNFLETRLGRNEATKLSDIIVASVRESLMTVEETAVAKDVDITPELKKDGGTQLTLQQDGTAIKLKDPTHTPRSTQAFYLLIATIVLTSQIGIEVLTKLLGIAK